MDTRAAVQDVIRSLDAPPGADLGTEALTGAEGLGDGPRRWVASAVEQAIAHLLAREEADRLAPFEVIRPLAQETLVDVLQRLLGERAAPGPDDLEPRRELVRDIVDREVDLHQVADVLRGLQRDWLAALTDHALDRGRPEVLPDVVGVLTSTVDGWVQVFVDTVLEERERRLDSRNVSARAVVEAVVRGEPVDAPGGSALLGVPLDGWHVCCVVAARPGAALPDREVRALASALAREVRIGTVLRYDTTSDQVWLWISGERRGRDVDPAALVVPDPLVVGLGGPHQGIEGMRRTHEEALDAVRLAGRAGRDVVAYADVALAAVLSQDAERAQWFVEAELGGLGGPGADLADLRETLRAFFATRMRVAPAAEQLFVHRNTFINRLERVERLLGHPVAERTAEVQAALLLHALTDEGRDGG